MADESTYNAQNAESKIEVKATAIHPTNGDGKAEAGFAPEPFKGGDTQFEGEGGYDRGYAGGDGRDRHYSQYGDRSRRMTDDEKFKRYKKQSEERLLDIKRSREAKIGKRRIR